ncbi:MAG: CoA-binding protein [Candidatus Scalindua rubra]|uniref:CoA-binding protein n=1 Tax=Candidatus Scalindua rubra TaxID=1872076 RepID=A0A1E3XEI1_9BACT|nr:MAG: CoA-binding protein [Candidatus Scalindua rubra]
MKESLRYLNNAKEILKKSPIEDNRYADVKYVKEACGAAYLAILNSIDEYLQNKGLSKKEMPKSVDAYRKALRKYLAVHDGKLLRQFEDLYDELHIAGNYRGDLHHVKVVKEALKAAKSFIEKIAK